MLNARKIESEMLTKNMLHRHDLASLRRAVSKVSALCFREEYRAQVGHTGKEEGDWWFIYPAYYVTFACAFVLKREKYIYWAIKADRLA